MRISILSVFPESFDSFRSGPVVSRAVRSGEVELETVDIKAHADGCFRAIDDSPYGGGPGMILRVDTLCRALESVQGPASHVVLLSPKGRRYDQKVAHEYSALDHLVLVCGHYEGVDARFEAYADELLSVGDFILTGGELAAMMVCDSVIRLKKGSIREDSTIEESFEQGLLEYPQYTHPAVFGSEGVPPVLLSGNDEAIRKWRLGRSILETARKRPDLLGNPGICRHMCPDGTLAYDFNDFVLLAVPSSCSPETVISYLRNLEPKLGTALLEGSGTGPGFTWILVSRPSGRRLKRSRVSGHELSLLMEYLRKPIV